MTTNSSTSTRWGVAVALLLAMGAIYLLRFVLLPFAFAAGLAYIGLPVVRLLHRRWGMRRWLAVVIVYSGYLVVLGALGWGIYHFLVPEASRSIRRLPQTISHFLRAIFHGNSITFFGHTETVKGATAGAMAMLQTVATPLVALKAAIIGFSGGIGLMLTLVLLFYFLLKTHALVEGAIWLAPPALRPRVRKIVHRCHPVLGQYIRGVLMVVVYATVLTFCVTHFLLHFPHALLLGIGVGILEMVPVIGPALSIALIGLVAVQQASAAAIVGFALFAIGLRVSIDQMVGPVVLGRAVTLSPVVVIFAFLAGGTLYGILGVLLAIPVAAVVKIVLQELYETPPEPAPAEEPLK